GAAVRYGQGLLFGVLAVPLLVPMAWTWVEKNVQRDLMFESERPFLEGRERLVAWMARTHPDPEPFFRIALAHESEEIHLLDLAAAIDRPFYETRFTPAQSFLYHPTSDRTIALEALDVRYL